MTTWHTIESLLEPYKVLARQQLGKNASPKRMRLLLSMLGNPEKRYKVVHLAGTSGKTSTAYYVARLLQASGTKVGLTISPHVVSLGERVQIQGEYSTPQAFLQAYNNLVQLIVKASFEPTYHELLLLLALMQFAESKVDYAVAETGIGGRYDASNVFEDPLAVRVITDIGMDHMPLLGNSLIEIADQKAGIIHTGNHVFMHQQAPKVVGVVRDESLRVGAELHILSKQTKGSQLFQARNFELAEAVVARIAKRDKLALPSEHLRRQIATDVLPGRMEVVMFQGKQIVLDGAHNLQKMAALVEAFQQQFPGRKADIMLADAHTAELQQMQLLLKPITRTLVICSIKESLQALPDFMKKVTDIGLVCGSFHLLQLLRPSMVKS